MCNLHFSRRGFLGTSFAALSTGLVARPGRAQSRAPDEDAFTFEVTRTEAEWQAMLSDEEYKILRLGGTEPPKSDPMWDSTEAGIYSCKGCDLAIYDAEWKVVLDIGWLFFRHSQPNAVLMGIDRSLYDQFREGDPEAMSTMVPEQSIEDLSPEEREALRDFIGVEVHCRRCGSHFGHIISVDGMILHCVNGAAFQFAPAA